jgi:SOS response regulatory protein OraA/RecX
MLNVPKKQPRRNIDMKKDETYLSDKVNYIKRNLQKGYNKDSLKWALVSQGNSKQEVDKAFLQAEKEMANESAAEARRLQSMQPQPKIEPIMPEVEKKKGFFSRLFG